MGCTTSKTDPRIDIAAQIQMLIDENDIVMFTTSVCPFGQRASHVFDDLGVACEQVLLDKRPDGDVVRARLTALTHIRTVPNIFIKGKNIGGWDELEQLHRSGQLRTMVKPCRRIRPETIRGAPLDLDDGMDTLPRRPFPVQRVVVSKA